MNVAADATLRPTAKGQVGDPFSSPWRRRLPLLPALLFAILVTQLPFLVSIYYSLTDLKDKTQSLIPEPTKFVGIDNYKAIFSDPFFRQAMLVLEPFDGLGIGEQHERTGQLFAGAREQHLVEIRERDDQPHVVFLHELSQRRE